ncbi:MAG: F0F1 ATP synthase subunit A [Thermoguttaceae bacterium]|jgi:F-type H+-transporting ATPase subunit a
MDLDELARHITDTTEFHFPGFTWHLPRVFGFQLTRFMVLELVAGAIMLMIFIPLGRRIRSGAAPRGLFWNLFEAVLMFIRDEVARPTIGRHDADRFLPFLWNAFFFILFCNLLGILPWAGSPTGALTVTAAMAGVTFATVLATGIFKFGPLGYLKNLVPKLGLPLPWSIPLWLGVFFIEVVGLGIRHTVLAVRLLANMFAGHMVLAVIVSFIAATAKLAIMLWLGVTVTSVLAAAALTLLELFVAFLQAYIFAFLSALFIGMAVHPH